MSIQWFPGHMAKARRQIEEKLPLIDIIIELRDARAPLSSENPMLNEVIKDKPKLTVLMKSDLADHLETRKWLDYFKVNKQTAIAVDVNNRSDIQETISLAKQLGEDKIKQLTDRGVKSRAIRAMIIGIPNVGKSTLINRLVNRRVTKIGDRPGITQHQLWIKVNKDFELLDTPGILWPKFEDQQVGYRLAALGTIKDQVLSLQDIAAYAITYLQENYPHALQERYGISADMDDMWDVFVKIGQHRGALESGGKVNFDKVSEIVLRDLRGGRLGKVTLEKVD